MKTLTTLSFAFLALAGTASFARAQTLIANFQASSFTNGSTSLTDTEGTLTATATGTPVVINGGGAINTVNGGFEFDADTLSGLVGSTSYTLAVGFTYNGGAGGGPNAYEGEGAFGGDLPGAGDGDANIGITSDGNGQIIASLGSTDGNDNSLYDTAPSNGGTFMTGSPTGAVLVVNGNTVSLYVNGALTTQGGSFTLPSGTTITPFGNLANGTFSGTYAFGIGENTNGSNGDQFLNGDFTQAEVYSGALSATQAENLSLAIAGSSYTVIPEPSTWALMFGGLGALVAFRRKIISPASRSR